MALPRAVAADSGGMRGCSSGRGHGRQPRAGWLGVAAPRRSTGTGASAEHPDPDGAEHGGASARGRDAPAGRDR
eukprot:7407546-Lingulodinium_polyedra.AAC.1